MLRMRSVGLVPSASLRALPARQSSDCCSPAVPDALLAKTSELKKYFDISLEHVSSLKPKPTMKKKAK
jgi:hypothetical protein